MKVSTEQQPSGFQPVTVTIVLESAQEVRAFSTMMSLNLSIPQLLIDNGSIEPGRQAEELTEIMHRVYQSMGRL